LYETGMQQGSMKQGMKQIWNTFRVGDVSPHRNCRVGTCLAQADGNRKVGYEASMKRGETGVPYISNKKLHMCMPIVSDLGHHGIAEKLQPGRVLVRLGLLEPLLTCYSVY